MVGKWSVGSSDSPDSERLNERPSKSRFHKRIVNRRITTEEYARMSHSSTEVAGYTVEYVGESMKRNGYLVEMGMYFSVNDLALMKSILPNTQAPITLFFFFFFIATARPFAAACAF